MKIVIAGGHGKIALLLSRDLSGRGITVAGLIRDPRQAPDLEAAGASPLVLDLESASAAQVADALSGADATVFAAGAGPNSGVARKYTVDRDGSVLLATAAESGGVPRFVQVSTMGAGQPATPGSDEVWQAYLEAKTAAEDDLRGRDLDWTILRPGRLTDVPGTGLVSLGRPPLPGGSVPRQDVASVLAELLLTPGLGGLTLELTGGGAPIRDAVRAINAS
ncbi:SDR family oxidoreductase [Nonomuraea sp. NBC_01738]|uniref:SDR family oxidoreductase n=1 Tax=Nonomuraea sp. NBC_01738 TaxID=2976003 RepID=UPI002E14E54A|nr:SDR family oxidoreductase [Nonomuraea sp. NBC_01738]